MDIGMDIIAEFGRPINKGNALDDKSRAFKKSTKNLI